MSDFGIIQSYGCIAEHLGHSFSGVIHRHIAAALAARRGQETPAYSYCLQELPPEAVAPFLERRSFCGINVTIPYKETVIPYLDELSETARAVGAVNTIVCRDGRLIGDNTDVYGMQYLLHRAGIDLKDKKVLIFGTGGTAKTARALAGLSGAKEILTFSRTAKEGALPYSALTCHTDAQVILNTTPAGMYPNDEVNSLPEAFSLSDFSQLCGVADAIYHPLRTELILSAKAHGIPATGGLPMLVAQAVRATERFLNESIPDEIIELVLLKVEKQKENIVLIGMPGCGKTTVGRLLSEALDRPLLDTDEAIAARIGGRVDDYLRAHGEAAFRELEASVIREEIAPRDGVIIATGGGAILRDENVRRLRRNGTLIFLDRPLASLIATPDRPLSSDPSALRRRFEERYDRYCSVCDHRICIGEQDDAAQVAQRVEEVFLNRI